MTKAHDQAVQDEADAEQRHQVKSKNVKVNAPKRVPRIDLSPMAADAPEGSTGEVQAALMDPPVKQTFELLIAEIRKQMPAGGGEGGGETGGVTRAEFDALKTTVISDLNNLRDAIMLTQASLDADAGVATNTFAAQGTPPPITTA